MTCEIEYIPLHSSERRAKLRLMVPRLKVEDYHTGWINAVRCPWLVMPGET